MAGRDVSAVLLLDQLALGDQLVRAVDLAVRRLEGRAVVGVLKAGDRAECSLILRARACGMDMYDAVSGLYCLMGRLL